MTITVVTLDHGKFEFPEADNWTIATDEGAEGILWVGKEEDGLGVAQFAKGSWSLVYETKDEPENLEPRVWESVADVPEDVRVIDPAGHTWEYTDRGWEWEYTLATCDLRDYLGPFTEVVE